MLEVDCHKKIGELVAEAAAKGYDVSISSCSDAIRVEITTALQVYKREAEILWPSRTQVYWTRCRRAEAIVEALEGALRETE